MSCFPRDAERLLLDPRWQRFACDYRRNSQFWNADAQTRDYRGQRLIDSVWPLDTVEMATTWLHETITRLLDGRPVELEPLREAEIPRPRQSPRMVHVPTYNRRCLSNLVSRVLADTSKTLLPRNVRAYVPGLHDPVPETILDLAEAVREGRLVFWWKVDFRSFFNRIPHALIQEALRHYGYSHAVANLVLACVRTPIHRKGRGGAWGSTPNLIGAPMGLAESSVVANLVCYALDDHFDRLGDRIFEVRYSDDNIGGTAIKSEGIGAVRAYRRWASYNGIEIKGTCRDTRTSALLHDIRRERLPALGAEIDRNGNVHIPIATIREKLSEIAKAMEAIELHGDHAVEGVSIYGGGRGTEYQDIDDVRESAEAFASFWSRLNQYQAGRFRSVVNKRHPTLFSSTGRLGTVWIASLGGPGGARGGGHGPPAPSPETTTTTPEPGALRAQGKGMDRSVDQSDASKVRMEITERSRVIEVDGTNDHQGTIEEGGPGDGIDSEDRNLGADWLDALLGEEGEDLVVETADGCTSIGDTDREGDDSPAPSTDGEMQLSQVVQPRLVLERISRTGVVADPDRPEPPRDPVFDNEVTILAEWVPRTRCGPGSFVRVIYGDREVARPEDMWTCRAPGVRPVVAVVQAIEHEVRAAASRKERRLLVRLPDVGLPKHLLQRRRRFHSPGYFGGVARVHMLARNLGVRVLLRGGEELPDGIEKLWKGAERHG